ncbi:hypothetical protein Nmel_005309 [Mimus melanotis]
MKYKRLPSSQAETWCFFQNFKMRLYNMGPTRPVRCRINQSTRPVPGKASGPLFGGWKTSLKIFLPRTAENDVVCHNGTSGVAGLFQKLMEIGESVNIHEVAHDDFFPIEPDQTKVVFAFYCTKTKILGK